MASMDITYGRYALMQNVRKIRLLVVPRAVTILSLLLLAAVLMVFMLKPANRYTGIYYGKPLKGTTIVVDPGHGGPDPGVHHNAVITEKEVVLAVALHLRRLLEQAGAAVIMTREKDEDISYHIPNGPGTRYKRDMEARVKLINESEADFFISIHIDSVNDPDVRGAIAFYCNSRPENKFLADSVQKSINPVVYTNPQPHQLIHQNPKEGSYLLLNSSEIPGIILEMAFMTSPDDRELIQQEGYRLRLAQAIFMGIVEYVYGRGENTGVRRQESGVRIKTGDKKEDSASNDRFSDI